ncbi:MAG TPA: HIT domain-containing protein, partial [Bacteroidota bacterium]
MKRLWSPWRSKYIGGFKNEGKRKRKSSGRRRKECILCAAARSRNDERSLVVWRGDLCFILMNRYPYNSGHLMVVPYKHVSSLGKLTPQDHLEIQRAIQQSMEALKSTVSPHGFNIGMNLGRV